MPKERLDRAKQFMPFDALKGFREALEEQEREIERKVTLSEEKCAEINDILSSLKIEDIIEITYYEKGKYITKKIKINKISFGAKKLLINDQIIYFKDIRNIKVLD